jgi:N utilization substance protein A
MNQQATPLEKVPDLDEGIVEKLVAAGITTVEAVADMTPEQLEEVPGIGPKTVEKISIAVNNYFSSLDVGEGGEQLETLEGSEAGDEMSEPEMADENPLPGSEGTPATEDEELAGGDESAEGPDSGGQSGDVTDLSDEAEASDESVEELVEEGQYYEAEVVDGIENAPLADEAEVTTHERPMVQGEEIPDEEEPGKGNT